MTPLKILALFLANRFPFWGNCHFTFVPAGNVLHVACSSQESWLVVHKDIKKLAALDIGVQGIVVSRPDRAAFVIEMISKNKCNTG